MNFSKWIDTFVEEKGIEFETFDVQSENGTWNFNIPLSAVVEQMKVESKVTQARIKDTIVRIDFANGDVLDFFKFLASKLAVNW